MDNNVIQYLNAMFQANAMLKKCIINQKEYLIIEQKWRKSIVKILKVFTE